MAKQNAIGNSSESLTIDPGASGDSYVQFDINGTGEFRFGVDDDASDALKLSQGSALGANDTLIISANGEVKLPLQPSFCAYNSVTDSNVTGDGTVYTVVCNTEVWDQTSDYDTGTGIFTAPCDGYYLICGTVLLDEIAATHTSIVLTLDASNRDATGNGYNLTAGTPAGAFYLTASSYIDMDATDVVAFKVTVGGGAKTVDVYGGGTHLYTSFSGTLIC